MRHSILSLLMLVTAASTAPAQEAKGFFAPKKVRLKFAEATPAEVIGELTKQSGYPIQMERYRALPAKPLVTLDTGETTFWQAFDEVCFQAKLSLADIHHGEASNLAQVLPPEKFAKYQDVMTRLIANDKLLAKYEPPSPLYKAAAAAHPKLLLESVKYSPGPLEPLVRGPAVLLLKQQPPEQVPTMYAGAFRFRVVVCETGDQLELGKGFDKELIVVVEVTAEPRFQDLRPRDVKVSASDFPQVIKTKRPLESFIIQNRRDFAMEHDTDIQRHLYLRFRADEKPTELRELAGSVKVQTFSRMSEVSLKNPLEAAGKSLDLGKWGKIEIMSVEKEKNGYRVQFFTKYSKLLMLLDDKNQPFARRFAKGSILFVPERGQGEPDRLVVFEPETETYETAFRFKNIPVKRLLEKKRR